MRQFYGKALEAFAAGDLDWDADSIRCILVRTNGGTGPYYTVSINSDQYLSAIPNNAACRPVAAVALTGKTNVLGVLDAGDVTFPTVAAGEAIQALVLYQHTGDEATSRLLAYMDDATGLPVTPTGVDIEVVWSDGSYRIARL